MAIGKEKNASQKFYAHSLQRRFCFEGNLFEIFGVNTISDLGKNKITLLPDTHFQYPEKFVLDMNDCPDIAQTVLCDVCCAKITFEISGLGTLKVKETDRLVALQNELEKLVVKQKLPNSI